MLESIEGSSGRLRAAALPVLSGLFGKADGELQLAQLASVLFILSEGAQAYPILAGASREHHADSMAAM